MPSPVLTEIDEVAEELTESLLAQGAGRRSVWQIEGAPTSGKSACLGRVAERLQETNLKPIVVAPPVHHLDAGPVALADVAEGLSTQGLLNGEVQDWSKHVGRWADRLDAVHGWVSDHSDEVVLLFDAPDSWGANRSDDDFFRRRGFQTALALHSIPCRRVIAGRPPVQIDPLLRRELSKPRSESGWLTEPDSWGTLSQAAAAVADSPLLGLVPTPLQVRLMVAAVALTSVEEVTGWFEGDDQARARRLVQDVAELMQQRGNRRLWDVWLRLSVTRRPFDDEVFERLLPQGASDRERDIAYHCLLFGESDLQMHDELKLCAVGWRRANSEKTHVQGLIAQAHQTLFEVHRERFERFQRQTSPKALRESMEAYHFASVTGDSGLIDQVTPAFVDQLDALGWSLSYEKREFAAAAGAFEQALRWDPQDDYAHHYLAFNLLRLGEGRLDDVELHFREAVKINSNHTWWRSRLIMFLIGRGRMAEARTKWNDALLELGLADGEASVDIYEHLHCWVADALLRAGEVVFAREVLDEVPDWARGEVDLFEDLARRADALLQLGEGDAVVPGWRLRPGWWEDGPERLQFRLATGEERVRWLAGRVEGKDERGIHVRAAVVEGDEGSPAIARSVIPYEQFDELCRDDVSGRELPAGSFLEIGLYVDPEKEKGRPLTVLRVLPTRNWESTGPAATFAARRPEKALA